MNIVAQREIERAGHTVQVTLYEDRDATPLDFTTKASKLYKAWANDEFCYVGTVARVITEDGLEGPESSGIWGSEYGYKGNYDYPFTGDYAQEEIAEAIELYEAALQKACPPCPPA